MADEKIYEVPDHFAKHALLDDKQYQEMYTRSIEDPDAFWAEQAENFVSWSRPWDKVSDWDFYTVKNRWFEGSKLNVC